MLSEEMQIYIKKLVAEKEYLCARFINETGLPVTEICIVERETPTGRIFYPDLKGNHFSPTPQKGQSDE